MSGIQEWREVTVEGTEGALCEKCAYRAAIAKITVHHEVVQTDETRAIDDTVMVLCDECVHEVRHITGLDLAFGDDDPESDVV